MAERVVRNVENDYLMCSICLGRYRDPRLLPCGHTFCKQCLEDHIKQTVTDRGARYFMCPNDRTQITCPATGWAPKDWAGAFPADTFLSSLLNAVMIHASADGESKDALTCETHKGRLKEFFCIGCGVAVCPYCVVKGHKGNKCECVGIEEAVEKFRPKIEILRLKLQKQIQKARKVSRGERTGEDTFNQSKEKALSDLTELETKLSFFYQTAVTHLADMKQRVRDAGNGQLTENQQLSVMLTNMNETADKFDDVCNHGSAADILSMVGKMEEQTREYDEALKTLDGSTVSVQVRFNTNPEMESVFENLPRLGSVVVTGGDNANETPRSSYRQTFNAAMSNTPFLATPRNVASSPRAQTTTIMAGGRAAGARRGQHCRAARPTRSKTSLTVKTMAETTSCWQLTGLVIVADYAVITDAHNNKVWRCELATSASVYQQMSLECPVCVTSVSNSTDVVVTLPEKSQMAIIATEDGLTLKNCVNTTKPYEGVSSLPDSRFVASCCVVGKQSVDIVDINGRVLKAFDKDESGQPLFSWPRFLSSTPSGSILVSDRDQRALICMDQNGSVRWSHQTTASPWGVSCHEGGAIYLCLDNNIVSVLSESGRLTQSQFITARDGVKVPYAVHAHGANVAVTEWGSNLFAPNSPWVHVFVI